MLSRLRMSALLGILVLVLAACGDGGGAATETSTETPDETAPAATTTATDEPAATDTASPTGTATATETAEPTEGGTETPTEEAVTRAEGDLVIWADDTRVAALQPFADSFGEENGVTVTLQELAFEQIRDQMQVAAPAGEGPDVIVGAHDWLGQLVTNGVVASVEVPNPDDFQDVAIEAFTYEGQLYGLPYAIENIALVRNTDLVPEAPATFEELEQTALELQESGEVELGLAIQADAPDPYHNYPLFTALGGYVFGQNPDGTYNPEDIGIDSEGGLAAAGKFREWVDSGLINPDVTYDVMVDSFGSGNAAFAITGPWAVSQEDPPGFQAQGVPYEVSAIPPVEGGTPQPFVGVQGFMVSAFAENGLLAQTFLSDYMSTEEAQLALFEAGGRPPALVSAFEQVQDDPDVAGFGASGAEGVPLPAIPEMGSVWSAWTDAYGLIYQGQGDPAENFTNAAEQIRTLIAEG